MLKLVSTCNKVATLTKGGKVALSPIPFPCIVALTSIPFIAKIESMSSSSSPSSNPQWIYDVFLSFRGEDTRRNFVSHLSTALSNAGINTFVDDESLEKGWELGPELLRAIEGSHISLVVFSENYAGSSWCLIELVKIMECHGNNGQVFIPIFYNVDPTVVRHQKGAFGEALEATAKKIYSETDRMGLLSTWRSALTGAANISGWDATAFR